MIGRPQTRRKMLLASLLASSIVVASAFAQDASENQAVANQPSADIQTASGRDSVPASSAISVPRSSRAEMMYQRRWGVDNLRVQTTSSGALVRFSYHVVDASKAAVLNDKKMTPYLVVERTGTTLEVKDAERVGQLRQVAAPENGRKYWMVFANTHRVVKPGDRVEIKIGSFRANALVVE